MKNKAKKLLCLAIALIMLLGIAACGADTPQEQAPPAPSQSSAPAQSAAPSAPPAPSAAPSQPPLQTSPAASDQTFVVGYSFFSQKFSSFFCKTDYDRDVARMTQVLLMDNDRGGNVIMNGIKGETIPYNGVDYFYDGIADFDVVQKSDGTVDYNIKLRDDIVFSDGTPMTIDDLIFNLYVLCDPAYDGGYTFYSTPVTGMQNYRTGVTSEIYDKYEELGYALAAAGPDNTNFSRWTEEMQYDFWVTYSAKGGAMFAQEIVDYCMSNYSTSYGAYLAAVNNSEVGFGMLMWGFADIDDDDVLYGEFTEREFAVFDGVEPTAEDYWLEIVVAYMEEIEEGGIEEVDVESAGTSIVDFMVQAFISGEGPKDPAAGGEINNIAGFKRTGDYSMTVTTDYFEATTIYQFGFELAPLHYYGDLSKYNYNNNQFGFPKGDLSIVKSVQTVPLGAGPYKFISYENGIVSFVANENYYKGKPKVEFVRFQEVIEGDKLAGIISGTFDLANPSFNDATVSGIKGYNSNGELSGNRVITNMVDNLGYGYIGIAANNVKVGNDSASQASKYLRTGLGTLFAVYRDTVVNSYYGDRASVIQYPISNTSWASPKPNDEGYRQAYSIDVDGNNIYTDSMNEAQRAAAALEATIGYLKAAGYRWDDAARKFTAAPAGAQMAYEVIIPGEGSGDHPSYGILTATKDALATIGITLEINDPADSNVLWRAVESGQAEIWCAAWVATIDPDMYQVYHSSNIVGAGGTDSNSYCVTDDELDELIMTARRSPDQSFRRSTYRRCLEIIMEWAVEVPIYQRKNALIFSPERVNMDTVTPDITTFWVWLHDLEKLEMN